jgi:hypothetical protein
VDVDDAQPFMGVIALGKAAITEDFVDAAFAVPDDDDRMGDEQRLAGALGDLAEDGIEQERHVVVDDGDHGNRSALADDTGIDVYGDHAIALLVLGDGASGEIGGAFEIGDIIGGDIFGRRSGQQVIGKPAGLFAALGGSHLFQLACGFQAGHGANSLPSHAFATMVADDRYLATKV